jgi:AcrR family transcriptional regulator
MAPQERVRAEVAQRRPSGALNVVECPSPPDPEGVPAPDLRLRLLDGVARAMAVNDYRTLTVERLAAAAGVDPATFEEHFTGCGDAVAAALDAALERLLGCLRAACASRPEWPLKVSAAVGEALAFAAAEPDHARLLCLEPLGVDAEVTGRLLAGNDRIAALLADGRRHCPQAEDLPRLTETTLVNGAVALVGRRLAEGDGADLAELEPQLVRLLLLPYVGAEEAARVAGS